MEEKVSSDTDAIRLKLYNDYSSSLQSALLSSYEQFDKAMLSLSGGGLALSLGFAQSRGLFEPRRLLLSSWGLFVVTILLTVTSLYLAPFGIEEARKRAEEYYIHKKVSKRKDVLGWVVKGLNFLSAIAFITGVIFTVIFISRNLGGIHG